MDFVSAFRIFSAKIDILIASLIEMIYGLIMQLASINLEHSKLSEMANKVYMIIGLFMLFKLALSVINFVINPDRLISKDSGFSKLIQKIVICLAMISLFPAIFSVMKNIQTIILRDNIIPKIFFDQNIESTEMNNAGKEVSYFVFSSFIDYNRTGDLAMVFPSSCPNIFIKEDYTPSLKVFGISYCDTLNIIVNVCSHFLTPYNNIEYEDYIAACGEVENRNGSNPNSVCMEYLDVDSRFPTNDYSGYYMCKRGYGLNNTKDNYPTINCGIKNGLYIFQLINKARVERDVSSMLDELVITARESDPLFEKGYCPFDGNGNEDPDKDAAGDYVFSYKFLISSMAGIVVLIMFIILAVDVAIRTIKLTFLQIISPIPIVSYIDVKESKLFSSWLKLLISTYLELFIKLASIFFSLFVIIIVLNGKVESLKVLETNPMAKVIFIIATFIFMFKLPKFISQLFKINSDGGLMSILKGAGKFILGAGSMAIAGVGGSVANLASGIEEKKGVGKTALSMIAGGNSAALRTLGNQISNKGNASLYNIKAGIRGSVTARSDNALGRHIGVRTMDKLRDIVQVNPNMKQDSKSLKSEIDRLKERQKENDLMLNTSLQSDAKADQVRDAFKTDSQLNRIYDDYDSYHNATGTDLTQEEYSSYASFYDTQLELKKQLRDLEKRLELETENERFRESNKKK